MCNLNVSIINKGNVIIVQLIAVIYIILSAKQTQMPQYYLSSKGLIFHQIVMVIITSWWHVSWTCI